MANNDQVDFALRLVDEASKPAQQAEASLKGVKKSLSEVEKAEKKAAEAHKAHAEAMKRVGEASEKTGADLMSFAATAGAAIAATAVAMVVAAEKWAIEASDFQTKSLIALHAIDGVGSNAKSTLDGLRELANSAGLPTEKLTGFYKELRLAGFEVEQVQDIMKAGLDVGAALGEDKGKGLVEAMKGVRSKGKLDAGALEQLKAAGLGDSDEFFEVLAGMQGSATEGKTKAQIEKLLADGKVDADTGTKAILAIVSDKIDGGGPLGTLSKSLGEGTVEGQLQALKNQMQSVFADSAVTGPFVEALGTINKLLDPTTESGAKIRATLGRAFQAVGDALSKITPDDIEKVLNAAVSLAGVVMDLADVLGGAFKKAVGPALAPLLKMFEGSENGSKSFEALTTTLTFLAEAIGYVGGKSAGVFLSGVTTMLEVPGRLVGLYDGIKDVFDRIPGSWDELQAWWDGIDLMEVGTDIVDGLWQGIKDGWKSMLENVEGLLDLLPDVAKKALGIASPSKVFAEIGGFVGMGFADGVEEENDNAQAAVEDMIAPPDVPTIGFGASSSGGSPGAGGRGGVVIESLTIQLEVTGSDATEANANAFAKQFAREFTRTVEGFSDETGSLDADTAEAA
jgi:hypothetical protein